MKIERIGYTTWFHDCGVFKVVRNGNGTISIGIDMNEEESKEARDGDR